MTIFEMLSISEQSTWTELNDAYMREQTRLLNAKPSSDVEATLLREKCSELDKAYETSRENYQDGSVLPVTASTYLKKFAKTQSVTLYSIPGPCYLASSGIDYCISDRNSSCSCSCCYDCDFCGGCYESCDILPWADTIIMVVAGIAAAIAFLIGIYKGLSSILSAGRNNKLEKLKNKKTVLTNETKCSKNSMHNLQRLEKVVQALDKIPTGQKTVDTEFSAYASTISKKLNSIEYKVKKLEEEQAKLDRKIAGR